MAFSLFWWYCAKFAVWMLKSNNISQHLTAPFLSNMPSRENVYSDTLKTTGQYVAEKRTHILHIFYTYLGIFLHISMNIFCCFLNTWKSGPWSCGGRQAWSSGAVSSKNMQKYPKIVCVCYSSRIWQKKWNTSSARLIQRDIFHDSFSPVLITIVILSSHRLGGAMCWVIPAHGPDFHV